MLEAAGQTIRWPAAAGKVHQYRIYRSTEEDFAPGPASYLTYVGANTTSFADLDNDFADAPKGGPYYYRASDRAGREGDPSSPCAISYTEQP